MKPIYCNCCWQRGVSLIEAVIAIGVLAVVIPMVCGTLVEAGKCGQASQAESRSSWMIRACMDEIRASRQGHPRFFTATTSGQTVPPTGEVWALAFAADGQPLGKLSPTHYTNGTRELDGKAVRYIALIDSVMLPAKPGIIPLLGIHIALEYPAPLPLAQRRKLDFHTLMP